VPYTSVASALYRKLKEQGTLNPKQGPNCRTSTPTMSWIIHEAELQFAATGATLCPLLPGDRFASTDLSR